MSIEEKQTIVVTGATGLQGSRVTRQLLAHGWHVRAVTRDPASEKAARLASLGAEVVPADLGNPSSLAPVFNGAYGVFSVQNPVLSGIEGEIRQGKNVADAASQTGVQHLVYASAGTGTRGTGVPSWESKLVVEDYLNSLGIPLTVLRPMAFMELMTEKKFFPAVSTWQVMPRLMGGARKVGWISADDLAVIVAKAFAEPEQFVGKELHLASDVQSIDECRAIHQEVVGKRPARYPMPAWMFARFGFVGEDLSKMWRWLQVNNIDLDTRPALAIHPGALGVRAWLQNKKVTRQ